MKHLWPLFLIIGAAVLGSQNAAAQMSRPIVSSPSTLGTSPSTIANGHTRTYLALLNQSATNTVYCTVDGSTPVATPTPNQMTIGPLGGFVWGVGIIPSNTIQCIASGAGTQFTVQE